MAGDGQDAGLTRHPVRHLDQVAIRVAQVKRQDRAGRACAPHRAFLDRDATLREMGLPIGNRHIAQETQIRRSGRGAARLGLKLGPCQMQVYLLRTELERPSGRAVSGCKGSAFMPRASR